MKTNLKFIVYLIVRALLGFQREFANNRKLLLDSNEHRTVNNFKREKITDKQKYINKNS